MSSIAAWEVAGKCRISELLLLQTYEDLGKSLDSVLQIESMKDC